MIAPAIVGLIFSILQFPVLFALIHRPEDVSLYIVLGLLFSLPKMAYIFWYISRNAVLKLDKLRPTFVGAKKILAESWPLAFSQGAILIYYNCDAIILGFTGGDYAVGQYTTAYNLMLVATALSSAIWNAYLPAFARLHDTPHQGSHISAEFASLLAWMGFPIAALGWAFGSHVVSFMYGAAFQDSGMYFEWLCLNIVLIFINIGIGSPLLVWGRQKLHFAITGIGAIVNLGLNLLIIPIYGARGAIVTTLIAEFVVLVLIIFTRYRKDITFATYVHHFSATLCLLCFCGAGNRGASEDVQSLLVDGMHSRDCRIGLLFLYFSEKDFHDGDPISL